jgi:asparagine synthase (glutamine-hydrolysing)
MCGICGLYNSSGASSDEILRMMEKISHRGPDDEGYYIDGPIGLGNRRLSIIDVFGGRQPQTNENKSIWIVFNGEIYNYRQLRQELIERGHVFQTQSDTEVILHLYEEHGLQCVEKLNGMFAFAVWDIPHQRLVLARDRLGQKPLYYTQDGNRFLFASEIKALLEVTKRTPSIDYESLHHYLSLRFIPAPKTFFTGIQKLPPAHLLVYQNESITISPYWQLSFNEKLELSENDLIEGLREKLNEAIGSHLTSDVPVGAFLSGGLDSSIIVAMMTKEQNVKPKTFSIGVAESDFNELPFAGMVAADCKTDHYEECVAPDLIQLLPRMVWHMDEPSDPIAACMYHSARLASKYVKVVLGGDGGDELFAGFDRYRGGGYIRAYKLIPEIIRLRLAGPLLNNMSDSFTYKSITQKIRWVHHLSLTKDPGKEYAEATCFFRFSHSNKKELFNAGLWNQLSEIDSTGVISDYYNQDKATDPVDRMLYADFMTRLPEHSLMLTDRMTMAHSLEARAPFLDHQLVEYLASFPSSLKIRNKETKYILRKLAREYLPEPIVRREKQGFMFPIAHWFRSDLYSFVEQTLHNSFFVKENIFKIDTIKRLLQEHRNGKTDHHVRLWMLLNLEIWHQMYILQNDMGSIEEKLAIQIKSLDFSL